MTKFSIKEATNSEIIGSCFKDRSQDLPDNKPLGLEKTTTAAVNSLDSISNLTTNVESTLNPKCNGKLGNKFLSEYGNCKIGNKTEPLYKVVDNTCGDGLINCMFGSVSKTAGSMNNLFNEIFNFEPPICGQGKVHLYGSGTRNNEEFHVKIGDEMKSGTLKSKVYVIEDFENLYNNVINHLQENNLENNNFNNNDNFTLNDISKIIKKDFINETYYVLLIIFLLFIVYKISNKK
tara:strand:+ start:3178 stop:3882 length:705 start_codon:yes stop_codon:yes gene_type:complete